MMRRTIANPRPAPSLLLSPAKSFEDFLAQIGGALAPRVEDLDRRIRGMAN
jgi:hypothetical protein